MILSSVRGAALALLVLLAPRPSAAESPHDLARALSRSGVPRAEDASLRLLAELGPATPLQAAALGLPEGRAALDALLSSSGLAPDERAELIPVLVDAAGESARLAAPSDPILPIGDLELSLTQLRAAAGPREGRDRLVVAARLRLLAGQAAQGISDAELVALVPEVVETVDAASVDQLLARVQRALFDPGDDQ